MKTLEPIEKGQRIVVNGNLQPYAAAYVVECIFSPAENRWAIVLEWPNGPGTYSLSRVWDNDEGTRWERWDKVVKVN